MPFCCVNMRNLFVRPMSLLYSPLCPHIEGDKVAASHKGCAREVAKGNESLLQGVAGGENVVVENDYEHVSCFLPLL